MNEKTLQAMSDGELLDAWRMRNESIAREDAARARGEGFWCGTLYLSDINWRNQIAEELCRRGLRAPG